MGIRIDQVNLESFAKVFPLKSDINQTVLETFEDTESITINRSETEDGEHKIAISLNPAKTDVIGGVKPGENVSLDSEGTLSVLGASKTNKGLVQIGDNIQIDSNNVISVRPASRDNLGLVKPGRFIDIDEHGELNIQDFTINNATKEEAGKVQIGDNIDVNNGVISVKTGSKDHKGLLQVGDNIDVTNEGKISVKTATSMQKGLVQIGQNITSSNGVISVRKATRDTLGLVKIGQNIDQSEDGTISIPDFTINNASKNELGKVQIGDNIDVNNGVISVKTGSKDHKGLLQVGQNISVNNGVISTDINKAYVDNKVAELTDKDNELKNRIDTLEDKVNRHETEINQLKESVKTLQQFQVTTSQIITELETRLTLLEKMVSEEIATVRPLKDGNLYIGQITLNGYMQPTQINLPTRTFTNDSYSVVLSPNSPTDGAMGEYWIEEKSKDIFVISNTGSASMVKCDFLIIPNEADSLPFNKDTFPYQKGTGTFKGSAGTTITLPHALDNANYAVIILPSLKKITRNNAYGNLGEYWVSNKTNTSFKVFNSGSDTTSTFDYIVVKTGNPTYNETTNPVMEGSGRFSAGETRITMETNISSSDYSVLVTPSENPNGNLGEYWIEQKTSNTFVVKNTGTATTSFDYVVVG